jgi:hypothetical protein
MRNIAITDRLVVEADEVAFMASAIGSQWATDVAHGSGNDLMPYITQLANMTDGGQFDPRAVSITALVNVLACCPPAPHLLVAERNALLDAISSMDNRP